MPDEITPDPEQGQSGDERPEWLPDKFENAEAFAKSYAELERTLTRKGEETNNLEAQLEDLYGRMQEMETRQQAPQQQGYSPGQDPYLLAYTQAMEQGDYQAALAIQMGLVQAAVQQNAPPPAKEPEKDYDAWAYIAEQTAIGQVGGTEEWARYKDRVSEEAAQENFDGLSAQQAGNKLARIYKMVKAEDVLENQQTLAERQAAEERQMKRDAQTMTGSSGRPPQPTRNEEETAAIIKAARSGSYESLLGG